MNSAESGVPASICMACSSVAGASTLSEALIVGLYQYIFVSSFPKRTLPLMYPLLRAPKRPQRQLRLQTVFFRKFRTVRYVPLATFTLSGAYLSHDVSRRCPTPANDQLVTNLVGLGDAHRSLQTVYFRSCAGASAPR